MTLVEKLKKELAHCTTAGIAPWVILQRMKHTFAEAVIEFVDIHSEDEEKSWSREWSYVEEAAKWLKEQEGI